ncbi:MAG: hypothetical protein IOC86_11850 [Aestuariivirga sp.]|nr:hypothetical protein [Aestuariivirga sp.]
MSIAFSAVSGATIFDVPTNDPRMPISLALDEVEDAARRYRISQTPEDGTALLDSIENLRRFVLVRRTLAQALAKPGADGGAAMGSQLCAVLQQMIGDVPSLVSACTRQHEAVMDRDMRRAIACLFFLGSLDPGFI